MYVQQTLGRRSFDYTGSQLGSLLGHIIQHILPSFIYLCRLKKTCAISGVGPILGTQLLISILAFTTTVTTRIYLQGRWCCSLFTIS